MPPRIGWRRTAPALLLAAVTLSLGLGAAGLWDLTVTAAAGLLDTRPYVEAVLAR